MQWIVDHGSWLVFLSSLLFSLKAPLPCSPVLIVAGGLAFKGMLNGPWLLLLATVGGVLGDLPWFYLGRRNGPRILHIVCTFSLDRPSCIGKMEDLYRKHGPIILVVARFIPGLAAVAAPMAGAAKLPLVRFLPLAVAGTALYSVVLLLSGIFLGDWAAGLVNEPPDPSATVGFVSAGLLLYVIYKSWLRFQEKLAPSVPRITVAEIKGEVIFVDVRGVSERGYDPYQIPGSLSLTAVSTRPKSPVVTYCSCPLEASAAVAAKQLRDQGWDARPLKGGWEAWKAAGRDIEPI
jgi:membrane protein DedA with SNARE-associated domain/rhodanese-related sulfurtransferase